MPLDWINTELDTLHRDGLQRTPRVVRALPGGRCEVAGRELLNFASNDYLDLAGDLRVIEAAISATQQSGTGARASALVSGRTPWHEALETTIARFKRTQSALLFPTGYAANVGTIGALVETGDLILCDRLNHACLIDVSRLSGEQLRVYPHGDVDAVRRELNKHAAERRRLIVTDSLFSMDGDAAPLNELSRVAAEFDAMLLVDEAHATGLFGEHGRGLAEATGIEDAPHLIRVGTLSKAIGSQGGFVAGSQALIDLLFSTARPQMFSTALTPAACAAATRSIEIITKEPFRREHLLTLSDELRRLLRSRGIEVSTDSIGPIIPIILGDAERTMHVASDLEKQGFLVGAIRPPTVPRGSSRLRVSLTTAHQLEDVRSFVESLPLK